MILTGEIDEKDNFFLENVPIVRFSRCLPSNFLLISKLGDTI